MDDIAKLLATRRDAIVAVIGPAAYVSKYIGETEKAIAAEFTDAERAGTIAVFDEVDDLFGRAEANDGPVIVTARTIDDLPAEVRERLTAVKAVGAFNVGADAYDKFMGRYSMHLSAPLARFAGVKEGQRVLDVGCGPGALTAHLVQCIGAENVSAVDPSEQFVEAVRERLPAVDARVAPAEKLPYGDGEFDAALAQLVVHFMADPVGGIREMARVSRGTVAACVWDHHGGRSPVSTFWAAAKELDMTARDEGELAGAREGHLAELFREAGLNDVEQVELPVSSWYGTFDEWWETYLAGVGPAGIYASSLEDEKREALKEACRARLPEPPFDVAAVAWAVRGRV